MTEQMHTQLISEQQALLREMKLKLSSMRTYMGQEMRRLVQLSDEAERQANASKSNSCPEPLLLSGYEIGSLTQLVADGYKDWTVEELLYAANMPRSIPSSKVQGPW
jgi:hypothetical protein